MSTVPEFFASRVFDDKVMRSRLPAKVYASLRQTIDDGKALLAIDAEDDNRIISTDKKAEKAGGLYLALAGVLVRPTDDIDTEKEYQLIALPE